jgi:hypothetical protein
MFVHPIAKDANSHGQLGFRKFDIPHPSASQPTPALWLHVELIPRAVADPCTKSSRFARESRPAATGLARRSPTAMTATTAVIVTTAVMTATTAMMTTTTVAMTLMIAVMMVMMRQHGNYSDNDDDDESVDSSEDHDGDRFFYCPAVVPAQPQLILPLLEGVSNWAKRTVHAMRTMRARTMENRACENDGTVCVRTTPAEPCVRGRQHPQTASLCSILFSMLSMVIGVHHIWRHCRRANADDDEVVRDSSHHNLSFQVLISQFFASRLPPPHFSESISPCSLPW